LSLWEHKRKQLLCPACAKKYEPSLFGCLFVVAIPTLCVGGWYLHAHDSWRDLLQFSRRAGPAPAQQPIAVEEPKPVVVLPAPMPPLSPEDEIGDKELQNAKAMLKQNKSIGQKWLRNLIETHPDTRAAWEAKQLLEN
jgi:hypothetical protein